MKEIRSLTGIRGIAAIGVLFLHYGDKLTQLIPSFELLKPIYSVGGLGVDLFFILSGFIITYVYSYIKNWNWDQKIKYITKRFSRIYPIHVATLLCLGLFVLASSLAGVHLSGNYSKMNFIYHVFLLQGFPFANASWNYPSWSISAEFFGYLIIFPLTIVFFRSRIALRHSIWISLTFILTYIYLFNTYGFGSWVHIARISFEFIAGAALYHGIMNKPLLAKYAAAALPYLILIALCSCYLRGSILSNDLVFGMLIMTSFFTIAGLASDQGVVSKLLGIKPIRYLGLISYSLYMSHALVEKVFKVIFPVDQYAVMGSTVRLAVFTVHIVVPFIVASALYHWCEEPARKYIQNKSNKWFHLSKSGMKLNS